MIEFESQKINIIDSTYEIIEELGNGVTSKIFLVKDCESDKKYICKNYKDNSLFSREYNNYTGHLKDNPSEHIIKFKYSNGINKNNIFNYIILEYAENGNIYKYIDKQGGFDEIYCKLIFEQILNGVKDLHEAGLCHKNLTTNNTLLGKNYQIKISNLCYSDNNSKMCKPNNCCAKYYKSPEALKEPSYDGIKSDIYSLGIILLELSTGKNGQILYLFYKHYFEMKHFKLFWDSVELNLDTKLSDELKDLILKMIAYHPENRYTIQEIFESNWMSEIKLEEEEKSKLDDKLISEFDKRKRKMEEMKNISIKDPIFIDDQSSSTIKSPSFNKTFFKDNKYKIKNVKNTFPLNDVIKINKSINPIEFINKLCNIISQNFTTCIIKVSEKSLKFTLTIPENTISEEEELIKKLDNLNLEKNEEEKEEETKEDNEDENDEENNEEEQENEYTFCVIDVKLFKYQDECYLLRFVRKSNNIYTYNKYFKIIESFV